MRAEEREYKNRRAELARMADPRMMLYQRNQYNHSCRSVRELLQGYPTDESGYICVIDADTRKRCESATAVIFEEQYLHRDRNIARTTKELYHSVYHSRLVLDESMLSQHGFRSVDEYLLTFARWLIENEANSINPSPTVYWFMWVKVYNGICKHVGESNYRKSLIPDDNLEAFIMTFALEDLFLLGY